MAETFYVTTPIYYVNARLHIGHAYTTIVADVLARQARLLGEETWFLTGADEHGQKIERSAAVAGVAPQVFADDVSASFQALWQRMGITHNQFIRTTDAAHQRGVQKLFAVLYERGQIYLSTYTGQYCVSEEMFVEGPPGTIGPDGRSTETVTEENFFFRLSQYQVKLLDLIESDELRITPEARKNEVLSFLRGQVAQAEPGSTALSAQGHPYVPGALKDLSVSRSSFTWGIPVPEPAAGAAKEKHVIYVWLDALANYITSLGYGDDSEVSQAKFAKFWPADLHLVGKEIIRFHCVYWPAFLLAAGLPLPKAVAAHGWLLFDDSKMSKSKGNIVRTETILDGFGSLCPEETSAHERDLFASDILRYFLLREMPFGQDGSFSFDAMVTRYNADLANGYGNLVSRTLTMVQQYFAGVVPFATMDEEVRHALDFAVAANESSLRQREFSAYLENVASMIKLADGHLTKTAPWKLAKDPSRTAELRNSLFTALETIRIATGQLEAFLPYTCAKVFAALGIKRFDGVEPVWEEAQLGALAPIFPRADKKLAETMMEMEQDKNSPVGQANAAHDAQPQGKDEFVETALASEARKPLSKLVDETSGHTAITNPAAFDPAAGPRTATLAEPNAGLQVGGSASPTTTLPTTAPHAEAQASGIFGGSAGATVPEDASPQIGIEDFAKVELRVAKILVCERIPKADKLLRLEVDLGYERRQILSGIAEWYTPEDLLGRRIVVITNLAPRKMRGLESHGMLLAASSEGGKPALATFLDVDTLPLGSRLK